MTKNKHLYLYGGIICLVGAAMFAGGFFLGKNPTTASVLTTNSDVELINGFRGAKVAAKNGTILNPSSTSLYQQVAAILDQKFPFKDQIPDATEKLYGAIEGMVASYGDPYTTFFPPKESKIFADDVKGSFGGVGMEVGIRDGVVTVIAPIKGNPAEAAGILAGDIIIKINGESTEKMNIDTAISKIRGEAGTKVKLTIIRDGESKEYELVRSTIKVPTLETKVIQNKAFSIEFYSFTENSQNEFRNALREFNASKYENLIVDLRNNPGGYLDSAIDIASEFLSAGSVIVKENGGESTPEMIHRSSGGTVITKPYKLIILVNGGSASASEILAGALKENNRAILVGTKTFGKGSVQELIDLPDGSSVKVTVAKWFTPSGVSISDEGIHPDTELKESPEITEWIKQKKDPYIETALPLFGKAPLNQPNR